MQLNRDSLVPSPVAAAETLHPRDHLLAELDSDGGDLHHRSDACRVVAQAVSEAHAGCDAAGPPEKVLLDRAQGWRDDVGKSSASVLTTPDLLSAAQSA